MNGAGRIFSLFLVMAIIQLLVSAQNWNSNAGGFNTCYGTVYGSFGLARHRHLHFDHHGLP